MPQTVGEYLGHTKPPVINQHAVSEEYRERFPFTGGGLDRYCKTCGRLPPWCECHLDKLSALPDLHDLAERVRAAR